VISRDGVVGVRFDRVRLSNFKCYGDADLTLNPGVTVIHGLNGSGKSSLLEACFFALYGARALDTTLDDVVTIGADDTEVELWFTHGGEEYHVERRVRATGERATTASCVLEAPGATIEGARDVRAYVTDLLRMDAEAFVNCAYVRQGEVNKLINATPDERQDMLDSLLQLGKLEDYRERASKARRGVGRVRDDKRGALAQVDEQITEKEDADPHERLNDLESDLAEVEAEIDNLDTQHEKAVETRDEARTVLEEYEEKREELAALESDIEGLRTSISETEREREDLSERIDDLESERESAREDAAELLADTALDATDPSELDLAAVAERVDHLDEEDDELQAAIRTESVEKNKHDERATTLRDRADEREREAEQKREEAGDLESEVESTRESLADRREKLADLNEGIERLQEEFEDLAGAFEDAVAFGEAEPLADEAASDLEAASERVTQLETEVEAKREAIREAEALREAGKCPECGQDVEGAPHVATIEEEREEVADLESDLAAARDRREACADRADRADRLVEIQTEVATRRDNRANVEQLVEEKESALETTVEEVEQLRADAADLESEAEQDREAAADHDEEAEACTERIAEHNQARADLAEHVERLERVESLLDRIDDAESEIERIREKRDQLAQLNDERRETLADKREQRDALESEFDESRVETAREERDRAETYIEQVEPKLESLRDRRDSLQAEIGGVEAEIEELESLRERRERLAATVDRLDSLYDEAETLQEMYGDLRSQLRQRNVESLEAMLNETFELVYQNNSYARIELSGEYELTVSQKDGERLDPEQLSGGERALFNLSLRCAIYRLLAEGIDGTAPMPPLILDEPTVFLDSGHVSRLVELVEAMYDHGVEQILVVSHDEELVAAADDVVRVEKDAQTNRSTVSREEPADRLLEAD